jgi:UPF0755 protein
MLRALFVCALLAVGAAAYAGYTVFEAFDADGPAVRDARILIKRGNTPTQIANRLEREGVLDEALVFRALIRLEGKGGNIRAGEFLAPARSTPRQVLTLLTEGPTVVRKYTVPEGATTVEALGIISAAEGLVGKMPRDIPEGALLPETYHYDWNDTRVAVVARMQRAMEKAVAAAMATRPADHPITTALELMTLASIVEKETGLADERPRVAAVFVNRLKRGMLLQSDPTTIYAVTRGAKPLGRSLTHKDLRLKDPYNTYTSPGLPPGPIASPGKAALMAAANPPVTKELYFVADGTGGHAFGKSLAEHNRNVRAWRKVQRKRGLR